MTRLIRMLWKEPSKTYASTTSISCVLPIFNSCTMLYDVDHGKDLDGEEERVNFLLYNLALLEYNSFWQRSHPAIRDLEGYQRLEG